MSDINIYPGDGMGGEVKSEEEKKWKEKFMKSWLELYRYHEVYPWVEGKDIAEQFYLLGRKDEQKVRQEDEITLELAFAPPDGKFSGIIIGECLIENGEVVEYIKKEQEEIEGLKDKMKGMVKFVERDITKTGWTSTGDKQNE